MILPVAKAVYLCDGHLGFSNQKTDLMGIFNSIRASQFPHRQKYFVVYARLGEGLGKIPFHVDVRFAATQQLIHVSSTHILDFPNRDMTVEMVVTIQGVLFPQPGIYLVELSCNNQWLADAKLELL